MSGEPIFIGVFAKIQAPFRPPGELFSGRAAADRGICPDSPESPGNRVFFVSRRALLPLDEPLRPLRALRTSFLKARPLSGPTPIRGSGIHLMERLFFYPSRAAAAPLHGVVGRRKRHSRALHDRPHPSPSDQLQSCSLPPRALAFSGGNRRRDDRLICAADRQHDAGC